MIPGALSTITTAPGVVETAPSCLPRLNMMENPIGIRRSNPPILKTLRLLFTYGMWAT
jgi:hypothetical protein